MCLPLRGSQQHLELTPHGKQHRKRPWPRGNPNMPRAHIQLTPCPWPFKESFPLSARPLSCSLNHTVATTVCHFTPSKYEFTAHRREPGWRARSSCSRLAIFFAFSRLRLSCRGVGRESSGSGGGEGGAGEGSGSGGACSVSSCSVPSCNSQFKSSVAQPACPLNSGSSLGWVWSSSRSRPCLVPPTECGKKSTVPWSLS